MFTAKFRSDESLNHYKARLVVKGFTQTTGIDYQETIALVAKLNIVCVTFYGCKLEMGLLSIRYQECISH